MDACTESPLPLLTSPKSRQSPLNRPNPWSQFADTPYVLFFLLASDIFIKRRSGYV